MLRMVVKCFRCGVWCLEKTIRFISFYGLVFVALQGCSFCKGCASTFKLLTECLDASEPEHTRAAAACPLYRAPSRTWARRPHERLPHVAGTRRRSRSTRWCRSC